MVTDHAEWRPAAASDPSWQVEDLIKRVVSVVAPAEVDRFDQISATFFADPARAMDDRPGRDKPTGFGLTEIHTLVTVVLLNVFYELVSDQVKEAAGRAATRAWRRLGFRRRPRLTGPEVLNGRVAKTRVAARLIEERLSVTTTRVNGDVSVMEAARVIVELIAQAGDDGRR